jgi:shikimate dehydrogenase
MVFELRRVLMRCAVLGSPISHSLSPVLHRAAYDALGVTGWRYDAYEVDETRLRSFVDGLDRTWRGLSLTRPLKRAILPLLDELGETARVAGVVNTVLIEPDGQRIGDNTDTPGLVNALRVVGVDRAGSAVIAGAGATAASAVLALHRLGVREILVLARAPGSAAALHELAGRLGMRLRVQNLTAVGDASADLLISTLPAEASPAALARVAPVVFDVVYRPWPTPLVEAASRHGAVTLGGLDLLVHQAALQVEAMLDVPVAPLEQMKAAGRRALGDPRPRGSGPTPSGNPRDRRSVR